MRNEPNLRINQYRKVHPSLGGSPDGKNWGYFEKGPLRIVSSGEDDQNLWEHVSISCVNRCPTWDEMESVKQLFWGDAQTVIQFHPKKVEYVNIHPYCLHLWRHLNIDHDLPPELLV